MCFVSSFLTYASNSVIEAWSKSSSPDAATKAANVLRRLANTPGVEPDSFSFNQVLAALGRKGSAKMAEELLFYMDKTHRAGVHRNTKPESESYVHVIQAHTRSGQPGAAVKAERLLRRMKELYFEHDEKHVKPNRNVYNAVSDQTHPKSCEL